MKKKWKHYLILFQTMQKGLRDRVVIELLYATGIRVSELVNIKVMDLDMNLPGVKVLGKEIKNDLCLLESFVDKVLNNI